MPLKNTRGFSLIEVMVVLAITGVIMYGIMDISTFLSKQQRRSNIAFQASIVRNMLVQTLNNNASWANTYRAAANRQAGNMDCLSTGTRPCTTDETTDSISGGSPITAPVITLTPPPNGTPGVIYKVYDSGATVDATGNITNGAQPVYDRSSSSYGYSADGAPCNTFNDASPVARDACPLRFDVTWQPKCSATTSCINPQIQIKVTMQYSPGNNVTPMNSASYSAMFIQGSTGADCWTYQNGNLYETCGNIGIETIAPAYALDVAGTIRGGDLLSNSGSVFRGLGEAYLDSTGATGIHFRPGQTEQVTILNSGNVGIGNTAPAQTLDVNGGIKVGSTSNCVAGSIRYNSAANGSLEFCDNTLNWQPAGGSTPSGAVQFFDLGACPQGWSPYGNAQGRYIVGITSGSFGATQGSALSDLENRATGAHTHNLSLVGASGNDAFINRIPAWGYDDWHGTVTTATTDGGTGSGVPGTNAPYVQLLVCRKD